MDPNLGSREKIMGKGWPRFLGQDTSTEHAIVLQHLQDNLSACGIPVAFVLDNGKRTCTEPFWKFQNCQIVFLANQLANGKFHLANGKTCAEPFWERPRTVARTVARTVTTVCVNKFQSLDLAGLDRVLSERQFSQCSQPQIILLS